MEVSRRGTPPPSSVVAPLIAAPVFSSVPPVAPTAPRSGIGGWTRGALYWAHFSMAAAKHLNVSRQGVESTIHQCIRNTKREIINNVHSVVHIRGEMSELL